MSSRTRRCTLSLLILSLAAGCNKLGSGGGSSGQSYQQRRQAFKTQLTRQEPAPQQWQRENLPPGVQEVQYTSGNLNLKAWLAVPGTGKGTRWPAIVYFHGGFAFGKSDLDDCKPFLDAGYLVLCPMLRGENGNPGSFELLYGEVDDAVAAVKTLAAQPNVDPSRIYAFGHSIGGGISALLSLNEEVPLKHSGSCGGLYDVTTFPGWRDIAPFDVYNDRERELRVLLGNLRYMKRPHYAYVGRQDELRTNLLLAEAEMSGAPCPLTVKEVQGDHFQSLRPAMLEYLRVLQNENP